MKNSEIFDNFIKIAQEKELADSADSKKKLEQTGRVSYLSADDIAKLYNTKPESPKEMEYKSNIMEIAHPTSAIVFNSHDKINGLVENEMERQNITLNVVNKSPNGNAIQKKYAEKELMLSLVRLANDFDNSNQNELRIIADNCLFQLTKTNAKTNLTKKAAFPLIPVVAVAATLAAIYAHQHLANSNRGLEENYKKLNEELDDFLNANNSGLGITGHEYSQELLADVREFKDRLSQFYQTYSELNDVIRELERPKDVAELVEQAKQPKTNSVLNAVAKLRTLMNNLQSFLDTVQRNFKSDFYKSRHVKDRGAIDSVLETKLWGVSIMGGNTSLFADDFQDVLNAIAPFKTSAADLIKVLEDAKSIEENATKELSAAQAKAKEDFGPSDLSAPYSPSVSDIDSKADDLAKLF